MHENMAGVRAAMQWSLETTDRAVLGLEVAVNLRWFWRAGGYFVESRRWLERLIAAASGVPPTCRARAEITVAPLAHQVIDFDAARASLHAGMSRLGDESSLDLGWTLSIQASNEALTRNFHACTGPATKATAIADRFGASLLKASAELSLGMRDARRGDHEAAVTLMTSVHDQAICLPAHLF